MGERQPIRILLVGEARARTREVREALEEGASGSLEIEQARTLAEALGRVEAEDRFDAILLDPGPLDSAGLSVLRSIVAGRPDRPIVLVTAGERGAAASEDTDRDAEARRRLAAIVDSSDDAIVSLGPDGRVESWNRGAERYFGESAADAIGRPISHFLAPEVVAELPVILRRVRAREHVQSVDNPHDLPDGRRRHLSLSFSPLAGRRGPVVGTVLIARDITSRKLLEADLEELAYLDSLTRLANRRLLTARLEYALALARRRRSHVAVIYMDLSNFKEINDRFGHAAGDAVLTTVAERLRKAARQSDLVSRLGGDEFVILLSDVDGEEGALEAARRFHEGVEGPIRLNGRAVEVEAQVGIALFPEHGRDAEELLAAADRAMYTTKGAARHRHAASPREPAVAGDTALEGALRAALEAEELELHYQPIFRCRSRRLVGVEALLRWRHPERGLLSAGEFLPRVEALGLMPELDRWVLGRALGQMRDAAPSTRRCWLSVNLSLRTLRDAEALQEIRGVLSGAPLPPAGLYLEVRESPLLSASAVRRALGRLREVGVGVVLDNFGTGETALVQLRRLPADLVKLDAALVRDLDDEGTGARLAEAAMQLARAAGMKVAVEGVERASQLERIQLDGCDFLQGYYVGPPRPYEELFNAGPRLRCGMRAEAQ